MRETATTDSRPAGTLARGVAIAICDSTVYDRLGRVQRKGVSVRQMVDHLKHATDDAVAGRTGKAAEHLREVHRDLKAAEDYAGVASPKFPAGSYEAETATQIDSLKAFLAAH